MPIPKRWPTEVRALLNRKRLLGSRLCPVSPRRRRALPPGAPWRRRARGRRPGAWSGQRLRPSCPFTPDPAVHCVEPRTVILRGQRPSVRLGRRHRAGVRRDVVLLCDTRSIHGRTGVLVHRYLRPSQARGQPRNDGGWCSPNR